MMVIPLLGIGAVGIFAGWLICRAADYAPRFAADRALRKSAVRPLTPPASWAALRGPVDRLALGVELLSAAVLMLCFARFGINLAFASTVAVYLLFLLIAVIDLKHRLILNAMTYPALVLALLFSPNPPLAAAGGAFVFVLFALAAWLKPGQLGGGDVKLAALLGVIFGFPGALWALWVGAGLGAVVALALLLRKWDFGRTMPYAPFLCFGALVALLYNPFIR